MTDGVQNSRAQRSSFSRAPPAAPHIADLLRSYWWVSQNQTYREEVYGDFMWSPKTNKDGRRSPYYEFMRDVAQGDVVFSFSGSQIKAIGIVKQPAVSSPKPTAFGRRGAQWLDDGWLVEVAFYELGPSSVRPSEHMSIIAPALPGRYSPIRPNGVGNQLYLVPVPRPMALVLLALVGPVSETILDRTATVLFNEERILVDASSLESVYARTDIGATEKEQIIKARRGQGLFRAGVCQVEPRCRITGVAEKVHLVASHIKPWKKSNDEEKLDRFNGLLLSPHADHLFDSGYISFENTGKLLLSKNLDPSVLRDWHIDSNVNVGPFRKEQQVFLDYHRDAVLIR